jgi:hypothetical protein
MLPKPSLRSNSASRSSSYDSRTSAALALLSTRDLTTGSHTVGDHAMAMPRPGGAHPGRPVPRVGRRGRTCDGRASVPAVRLQLLPARDVG